MPPRPVWVINRPVLPLADLPVRDDAVPRLDLLARAKYLNADTPVILITAFGTVNGAVEAMKLGAADYILKPLNADELKVAVRRALERRQLLVDKVRQKIESGVKVTDQDIEKAYRDQNEKIALSYVAASPAPFNDRVKVTQTTLEKFFK